MTQDQMPPISRRLHRALVGAYATHVRRRLREAVETEGLGEALDAGERWLADNLTDLLSLPFGQQGRGPLEIFQEAMRFPTDTLQRAGVEPVWRDPVAESALPGDVYDLAPASSRDLGEEVWEIHLAWGAAKAAALKRETPPGQDAAGR